MQPKKTFVTNYKARNIYKVVDGAGKIFWIAESQNPTYINIVTRTADTQEELYREIEKDILFVKLHPVRVL